MQKRCVDTRTSTGGLCPFRHSVEFWAPPTRKFYTSVRPRQQSINALRRAKVISRPSTNGGRSDRKMDFSFFALSLLLSKDANFLARVPVASSSSLPSLSAFLPFRAFHQERRRRRSEQSPPLRCKHMFRPVRCINSWQCRPSLKRKGEWRGPLSLTVLN